MTTYIPVGSQQYCRSRMQRLARIHMTQCHRQTTDRHNTVP